MPRAVLDVSTLGPSFVHQRFCALSITLQADEPLSIVASDDERVGTTDIVVRYSPCLYLEFFRRKTRRRGRAT